MDLSAGSDRGRYQGERQTQNPAKKITLGPFRLIDTAATRPAHSKNIEELRRGETSEVDERKDAPPADFYLKKKHASVADLEKLKDQLDSFIKRLYASSPDETASFFDARLNEIEKKIEGKWASRDCAPNQVTQLLEEARTIIENSGSLSALHAIRSEIQDIKGNLNRVIELETAKQNLLDLFIPKFESCKKKLNDFGKHPISEDVIKSKLFDLLIVIGESEGGDNTPSKSEPPSVDKPDSPSPDVQEQIQAFESALRELQTLKSEIEDLKSFKETSLQVQTREVAPVVATSDDVCTEEKKTGEADVNRILIESALEELRGLKGAMETLASKQSVTAIPASAEEISALKAAERAEDRKLQEAKNARLEFLEQQISRLLEKTDVLTQSIGSLNESEEIEAHQQGESVSVERSIKTDATSIKAKLLGFFSEFPELLPQNISQVCKDNLYKLAILIAFPVTLIVLFRILDFASVNVENLGERAALDKSASVSLNHPSRDKPTRENPAPKQPKAQISSVSEKLPARVEVVNNPDDASRANQNYSADFDKAQLLFKSNEPNDVAHAIEIFEKLALGGFTQAQYRLGLIYEGGEKTKRNYIDARKWYLLAANRGNIFAMHNLASLIAEGKGGDQSYPSAVGWFEKAASQGMRDSQYNLGIIYAKGLGVAKDLVKSQQWFTAAAKQGDLEAAKKREEITRLLEGQATVQKKPTENIYAAEPKVSARAPSALLP